MKNEILKIIIRLSLVFYGFLRFSAMALIQAVKYDSFDDVKRLLENKANPNEQNEYGQTPLYFATYCGPDNVRLKLLECLVNHGADPTIPTWVGVTPLHCAANVCSLDCLKFLIETGKSKGFEFYVEDDWGNTLLHIACRIVSGLDRLEIVQYLLEEKFDSNQPNEYGNTPLYFAVGSCKDDYNSDWVPVVECLLKSFADPTFSNKKGVTPLDLAVKNGNDTVVKLLEKHVAFGKDIIERYKKMTWINVIDLLRYLPPTFQEQACVLAQLWSDDSNNTILNNRIFLNLVSSLPLELFHLLLSDMWYEYWGPRFL